MCTVVRRALQWGPLLRLGRRPASSLVQTTSAYDKLRKLKEQPGITSTLYNLVGMFSDKQFQAAAGEDLYFECVKQATHPQFYKPNMANVDKNRYYSTFQVKGLHFWLCHVRLRAPTIQRENVRHLFAQQMEHFWEQDGMRKLVQDEGLELLQALGNQKKLQFSWYGMCDSLDKALEDECRITSMEQVLLRNVYARDGGEVEPSYQPAANWLARYLDDQMIHHKTLSDEEVLRGRFSWVPFPQPHSSE